MTQLLDLDTIQARRRIRFSDWPTPRIVLADTPKPSCTLCEGTGEITVPEPDGEAAYYDYCGCWDPNNTRRILPLPRWLARRFFGWGVPQYSDEAPF